MPSFGLSLLAILPLFVLSASVFVEKRSTCIVASNGNMADSDIPALNDAISSCGSGGTIVLSEGKTYALNSVWNIGSCKSCEIQIEGITLELTIFNVLN
jgi:galacturan 1,4-alpha-galacturonidase